MNNTVERIRQSGIHLLIKEAFPRLRQFKKERDRKSFDKTMNKLIPGITRYIATWLHRALANKSIPAGKYKVADFVDDLYVQSYDHFLEIESSENLRSWLFKKADELLEDTEIEEEFDRFFFKNIDNYTKGEWEEMEEKYSIDGGGDMVMIEDLNDSSYPKFDYVLSDVFIEHKDLEIIEKLDKKLKQEEISKHIDMMLNRLPRSARTVYDLAVREHFKIVEIASIKNMPIQEVEKHLSTTREKVQLSFEKRYLQGLLGS